MNSDCFHPFEARAKAKTEAVCEKKVPVRISALCDGSVCKQVLLLSCFCFVSASLLGFESTE